MKTSQFGYFIIRLLRRCPYAVFPVLMAGCFDISKTTALWNYFNEKKFMRSPGEDFWCSRVPWWHYMSLKSYREGDLPPEHDVEFPSAPSPLFAHSHGSSQDSGPSLPHITSQASRLRASPWKYGEGFDSIYLGPVESCQPAWYSEVRHKFHGLTPRPGSLGPMIKVANSWKLVTCQKALYRWTCPERRAYTPWIYDPLS